MTNFLLLLILLVLVLGPATVVAMAQFTAVAVSFLLIGGVALLIAIFVITGIIADPYPFFVFTGMMATFAMIIWGGRWLGYGSEPEQPASSEPTRDPS